MDKPITIKDVRWIYGEYKTAAAAVGFDTSDWKLVEGTASTGVAFCSMDKGFGTAGTWSDGYLGMAKREVWNILRHIIDTLYAVEDLKNSNPSEEE